MKKQYAIVSPVAGIKEDLPSILIGDVYTPGLSKNIIFKDGVVKKALGRKKLFEEPLDSVDHTPTMTANDAPGPEVVSGYPATDSTTFKLFDGDDDTYAVNVNLVDAPIYWWWKLDFGEGHAQTLTKIKILPKDLFLYSSIKDFKLQGSNDDTEWTDLYEGVVEQAAAWQSFVFDNDTAYRYYRIYITSNYASEDPVNKYIVNCAGIEFWSGGEQSKINLLANLEQSTGDKFLVVGTHKKIYFRDISNFADITGEAELTGETKDLWFHVAYGDYLILTNGKDPILKWSGSGDVEELGGTPPDTAKFLANFKNYLIAANISSGEVISPGNIAWAGIGEMEKWAEGDDGSSTDYGETVVSDAMPITGLGVSTDFLVVYKQFSIHLVRFVGGDIVFNIEDRIKGVGTSSPASVVILNGINFFLGTDKRFYAFDGTQAVNISENIKDILSSIKTDNLGLVSAVTIPEQNLILWAVPAGNVTGNNTLIIYNTATSAWTRVDCECNVLSAGGYEQQSDESWDTILGTWQEQSRTWDEISVAKGSRKYLAAGDDGFIYEVLSSVLDNGIEFEGEFVTKKIDFGAPNIMRRILKMQHYFKNGSPDDTIEVSARLDNSASFSDEQEFDTHIENEDEFLVIDQFCDYVAKTLQLKFKSGSQWEYMGTIFYYSDMGLR